MMPRILLQLFRIQLLSRLSPLAKNLAIAKRSLGALTAFFRIIIGFISSNKSSNRLGDMRTSPKFCLFRSFLVLSFDKHC